MAPPPLSAGSHEHTPAKSSRTESLGPLSSPLAASCAPSNADLPLPSSTLSTPPPAVAKPRPTPGGTPPSIRTWLARTPGSPNPLATPPNRLATPPLGKQLSPCPRSPGLTPPTPGERRAKRRLETGEGGAAVCEGEGPCGCVSELYPAPKKRRGLVVCGHAPDTSGRGLEAKDEVLAEGASSNRVDKENRCSARTDWLSAISQRLKQEQQRPPSAASRSPGATKKPEARTAASPVNLCTFNRIKLNSAQRFSQQTFTKTSRKA